MPMNTYTIRMPDCGSVNKMLSDAGFVGLLNFALSPNCLCGIPTKDGVVDGDIALSFPKQDNQLIKLKPIISVSDTYTRVEITCFVQLMQFFKPKSRL